MDYETLMAAKDLADAARFPEEFGLRDGSDFSDRLWRTFSTTLAECGYTTSDYYDAARRFMVMDA